MYRLVFDGYLDRVLHHRNIRRREGVVWYPTRDAAERAAARLRTLGQSVSVQAHAATAARVGAGDGGGWTGGAAADGPLVMPD